MGYYGDFAVNATVRAMFTTNSAAGARVDPNNAFEAADVEIYKDGGTTQRSSDNGVTISTTFDSLTGVHHLAIDLSDNSDAGFYAAGHDYAAVLYPDETVDSQNVSAVVVEWSIQNRYQMQTGDSYARLGAPAGASVSADIALLSAGGVDAAAVAAAMKAAIVTNPAGPPVAPYTMDDILSWLLAVTLNKRTQTSTTETVYNDSDTTSIAVSQKSDSGTMFTRGRYAFP